MKIKFLFALFLQIVFSFTLSAQDKKKPESKRKHEKTMWDKRVMVNGKDTRFTKHRRRHFIKPGSEQKQ